MSDHRSPRLYVTDALSKNSVVMLAEAQSHYLSHVMRVEVGDAVICFNGVDGEWAGSVAEVRKKSVSVRMEALRREQIAEPDIWLCFAPIKNKSIDLLAEKACELGVSVLQPVMTKHTIVSRVNTERLLAHCIEAAEQCERITVPEVREPVSFDALLSGWEDSRRLVYGDETGAGLPALEALSGQSGGRWAVLTGPEGGFAKKELERLRAIAAAVPVSLGPRILRADTAAIAALTCVQVFAGDWGQRPRWISES